MLVLLPREHNRGIPPISPLVKNDSKAGDHYNDETCLLLFVYSLARCHHDGYQQNTMQIAQTINMRLHSVTSTPEHDARPAAIEDGRQESHEVKISYECTPSEDGFEVEEAEVGLGGQCN